MDNWPQFEGDEMTNTLNSALSWKRAFRDNFPYLTLLDPHGSVWSLQFCVSRLRNRKVEEARVYRFLLAVILQKGAEPKTSQ